MGQIDKVIKEINDSAKEDSYLFQCTLIMCQSHDRPGRLFIRRLRRTNWILVRVLIKGQWHLKRQPRIVHNAKLVGRTFPYLDVLHVSVCLIPRA